MILEDLFTSSSQANRAIVRLVLGLHGVTAVLAPMVDRQLLAVEVVHVLRVQPEALGHADPEEQQVDHLHARVLKVVQLEPASLFRLGAPVLPEGAVAQLFEFVARGDDVVVQPLPRDPGIEIGAQRCRMRCAGSVQPVA